MGCTTVPKLSLFPTRPFAPVLGCPSLRPGWGACNAFRANLNNIYNRRCLESLRLELGCSCLYSLCCRERLSEKGTSNALLVDLADIRRMKWTEKPLFVDPQGYAISVFEAFRTVSEEKFSETELPVNSI